MSEKMGWVEGIRRGRQLRQARSRGLAFCMLANRPYLPWALVLVDALRRHHPGARMALLYVSDEEGDASFPKIEGVEVLTLDALLDAEEARHRRRRYGIAELLFSLKPRLLRHALDRLGERAIYLDTDIDVLGPLDEALLALERFPVALTPHLETPLPDDGKLPSEVTILRSGIFNAGFVGVAEAPATRRFLDWWDARVSRWGFVRPELGYQGDQKWLDLAPTLFPEAGILRDKGANAGYWNLHARAIRKGAEGLEAGGVPLAFFHFSGFDPDSPEILSRYQNRERLADHPELLAMANDYAARIVAARPRTEALAWSRREVAVPQSAAGVRTFREGPMEEAAYRAAFEVEGPAGSLATGEEIVARLRITNASPVAWAVGESPEGAGGINLSWHMYDAEGRVGQWDNPRFPLPRDLAAGESLELTVGLTASTIPGRYAIEFDLVHEGVSWFSAHGSATGRIEVLVGIFEAPA